MEAKQKEVITSFPFDNSNLLDIYEYGDAPFGEKMASAFVDENLELISSKPATYYIPNVDI